MTRIIITVGPQGAGKTTFCTSLMAGANTERVSLFSRDNFLEGLFGKDAWNPYLGLYVPGMEEFWRAVAKDIQAKDVVLVDSFFPAPRFLEDMKKQLRVELGDSYPLKFEALWFTTPDSLSAKQYVQRTRLPGDHMYDFWLNKALQQARQFWATAIHLKDLIPTLWEIDPRQGILGPASSRLALPR
jgi:hypothetical protein